MRNCIDEGSLQAWLDGELPPDAAAEVAAHLHSCVPCAEAARTVEAENLVLSRGLAAEFDAAIPTERLRQRVDAAVAELPAVTPTASRSWSSIWRGLFPPVRVLAYASAVAAILLVGFFIAIKLRPRPEPTVVKQNPTAGAPATPSVSPAPNPQEVAVNPRPAPARPKVKPRLRGTEPDATSVSWQERQYERAIAKLNEALRTQPPMRPSLQVEYEYNLALINSAIETTRDVARKNPKDPQAAQFMQAAYQSKIDLMNQIADARVLER